MRFLFVFKKIFKFTEMKDKLPKERNTFFSR